MKKEKLIRYSIRVPQAISQYLTKDDWNEIESRLALVAEFARIRASTNRFTTENSRLVGAIGA